MNTPGTGTAEPPKGYPSEEAKRRFTLRAGILGAVFFILQFVLPMALMMCLMPFMMMGMFSRLEEANLDSAVWHDGSVWYTSSKIGFPPTEGTDGTRLMRLLPESKAEPVEAAALKTSECTLLAGPDRIWLIAADSVAGFADGEVTFLGGQTLGDCSRPFTYRGRPAVYENLPPKVSLKVFRDGRWVEEAAGPPIPVDEGGITVDSYRPLAVGEEIHFFCRGTEAIYHQVGTGGWQPAAKPAGYCWTVLELDGAPAIVYLDRDRVVGKRLEDGTWRRCFEHRLPIASEVGACATGRPGEMVILVQGFPGDMRVLTTRDGEVTETARHGGGFPFSGWFIVMPLAMNAFTILVPVVLAFVLSREMRRFRVCKYSGGPQTVPFAPLWRRACAQIVDALILGGPVLICWIVMMSGFVFEDVMFSPAVMIPAMLLGFGGMAWMFAGLFVFAYMEGTSGQSPGKRVMGIRVVGLDLRPIGFGRALVRALLKFLDGFFGFMVGVMLVALTDNWQRIGDMAARSVVVTARPGLRPHDL